jgi:hypothetical protein
MARIAISYRRTDTDAIAGRIKDRLVDHYGPESVFMDIDNVPFGVDFREHVKQALLENDAVVAIIGPKWLGHTKSGQFRIQDETDLVRIEIETALRRGIPVVPVLVDGASMPTPGELPEGLKDLAFRNAAEVDMGRDFHVHMERLIRSMDRVIGIKADHRGSGAAPSGPARRQEMRGVSSTPANDVLPTVTPAAESVQATPARSRSFPISRPNLLLALVSVVMLASLSAAVWLYLRTPETITPVQPERTPPQPPPTVSAELGCKLPVTPVFSDNFKEGDPAWQPSSDLAYFADQQLVIKPAADRSVSRLYGPLRFKNTTVCADIKSPSQIGSLESTASAGVMFWATDLNNFYLASVYANGTYALFRKAANSWLPAIVPRTSYASIKPGTGAVNEVLVRTEGNMATLFVNGAKVQQFRGQPPKENSTFGIYGQSGKGERAEWRFLNVAATDGDRPQQTLSKPPEPQIASGCRPLRTPAFEENFTGRDFSITPPASVAANQLTVKPLSGKRWNQLYPLLFTKATICVRLKSPAQLDDLGEASTGGLVFWSANDKNYYKGEIYPNGRFAIYRLFSETWSALVPPRKVDSVQAGLGAENEVMVSFNNDVGRMYVNGTKVWDFKGQVSDKGAFIGLYAQSGKSQTEWTFSRFEVVENAD